MTSPTRQVLDPSPAPGSPEWRGIMTASKVAAVIGLSPWQSRFSLWHDMAGLIEPEPTTTVLARGHFLEPAIRDWFTAQHPDWVVTGPDGMWTRSDMPWAGATPDGWVKTPDGDALLECKTDGRFDHAWGQPGMDEIPLPYRCQVMWQMHITGAARTYIAVLHAGLEFREYVVDYDEGDAVALVAAAAEFMGTLPGQPGERRPDLDADESTYQTVRKLHPDIDRDESVEIGADLHAEYAALKAAGAETKRAEQLAKTRILDLAGCARTITAAGTPAYRRQPAARGAIALVPIKEKAA